MRKIELAMVAAAKNGVNWAKDNTRVHAVIGGMEVQLHGNTIGVYEDQGGGQYGFTVNKETLKRWPSNTTKSRIRAFGVDLVTKKGVIYLNGEKI